MDRCVVLVDAGYLLGAAASLLAGDPSRSRIAVDHAALIQGLRERARAETGCELLRIYWFDGAPDRVPQPEHRRLRVMPRVTVRLGALTRSDGRWAQKGVDAAMHAELTELARNRACADIVLVTGDGDLLPGLMSAKEHGVAVHLWAVQAADGDYNQSEDLVAEADERRVLDREWITHSVRVRDALLPGHGQGPTRPEIAAILSAPLPESADTGEHRPGGSEGAHSRNGSGPGPDPSRSPVDDGAGVRDGGSRRDDAPSRGGVVHRGRDTREEERDNGVGAGRGPGPVPGRAVPTPRDLARVGRAGGGAHPPPGQPPDQPPAATLRWSSDRGWVDRGTAAESPETASLPSLAQLTTAEQRWADREEDITTVSGDPYEVGQVFARRWADRIGAVDHLSRLAGEYPRIPHRVDGELLRYAARFGLLTHKDDQIDEQDRYAIRAGFWREIESRSTPGSITGPPDG
ncbi:NYN domain-containing protein [Streptomyces sp. ST2-7A]|uniref:NYN domain-containing protein n=1 Tax=Streptomyces sp. ST2-7A TaxID=2907214 RepID=UPI001F44A7E8|nr:NYN domain-containing protein [Streptomyces sp. ST2-7A]MCE7082010.1 NYN domain-containing protein [Streptomyces sp. ST2-7A]